VIEPRSRPRPGSAGRGRGPDMGGGSLLVALNGTRVEREALLAAAQRGATTAGPNDLDARAAPPPTLTSRSGTAATASSDRCAANCGK
jgi:hypothetical protein